MSRDISVFFWSQQIYLSNILRDIPPARQAAGRQLVELMVLILQFRLDTGEIEEK